jgi:hypothetical protein
MTEHSVEVIETKLDILIDDFQRFRDQDRNKIKELYKEVHKCNLSIAEMNTTLSWHKVIGASIISFVTVAIGYQFNKGQ